MNWVDFCMPWLSGNRSRSSIVASQPKNCEPWRIETRVSSLTLDTAYGLANHLVQLNHKAIHTLKVSFLKSMLRFRFELLHSSFEPEPWGISWSASAACHGTSHQLHHGNDHLSQKRSRSKRRITVRPRMEWPNTNSASPKDQIAEVAVQLYPIGLQKERSTMRQCSSFTRQLHRPWNYRPSLLASRIGLEEVVPPRQKYGEEGGLRRGVQTPAALQAIWVQVKL